MNFVKRKYIGIGFVLHVVVNGIFVILSQEIWKLEAQIQNIYNFELYYKISISEIINYSCFPDCLGHLWILLDLTKDYQEWFNDNLAKSLSNQFMELFSPEDEIYQRLQNKLKNNEILIWGELEKIQDAYLKKYII